MLFCWTPKLTGSRLLILRSSWACCRDIVLQETQEATLITYKKTHVFLHLKSRTCVGDVWLSMLLLLMLLIHAYNIRHFSHFTDLIWYEWLRSCSVSMQSKVSRSGNCVLRWQSEEPDLFPYILHMEVVWARLISISSDRLCFQWRMSVSFKASISLCAVLPCVAPCWTNDWMPRDAKYCKWRGLITF